MSDDIVTRLRETEAYWKGTASHEDFVICGEAANEIERWRNIAKELYTWLHPSPEDDSVYEAGIEAMTMYCEAVRNDDIVTRLRQEWEYGNNAKGCDYEMFAQAADEIERLRADLKEAKSRQARR